MLFEIKKSGKYYTYFEQAEGRPLDHPANYWALRLETYDPILEKAGIGDWHSVVVCNDLYLDVDQDYATRIYTSTEATGQASESQPRS